MSPKEAVLAGLAKLYKDKHLLHILDIVCDYEAVDVFCSKAICGRKEKRRHIGGSLRVQGFPEGLLIAFLFDELDTLKVFLAQQILKNMMVHCSTLAKDINQSLTINATVR